MNPHEHFQQGSLLLWMFGAGLLTGLGHLLASERPITARVALGRMISSGTLGVAAGAALTWVPDMPLSASVGLSCALVSLGTSGLERLFTRFLGGK